MDARCHSVSDLPYTLSFVVRKRMQIDGWLELPKEKQPPENIWHDPDALEEFFERVFSNGEKQTDFNLPINETEIE